MKPATTHPPAVICSLIAASTVAGALWICLLAVVTPAAAQTGAAFCGGFRTEGFGPYDYRNRALREQLSVVEVYHFTPEVETLIRGKSAPLGGDIDYTLDAFPNHHRALVSMARLVERTKNPQPEGAKRTIECYFDRAVRFAPTDTVAKLLYAEFLIKANRRADAAAQLDRVARLAADNAFTHYNLGLLHLEMKDYDKALAEAHQARELGLPKTELMEALKKAGRWREAAAQSASAPASGASSVPPDADKP